MIKQIQPKDTLLIRKQVLRDNKEVSCEFVGDFEESTFHLGAFYQEELVGIATFMKNSVDFLDGTQYQLRGMATVERVRGLGFGKELLNNGFHLLQDNQTDFLWCNAREVAVRFYEKSGFQLYGDSFKIEEIGTHFKMFVKISL